MENGILPRNEADRRGIQYERFALEGVQQRRHNRVVQVSDRNQYNIHDLVPVYLTPKTPTLSRVRERQNKIFFIVISSDILLDTIDSLDVQFAFSDGNATNRPTRFYWNLDRHLENIPWNVIRADYWADLPDATRRRNSEFLIHPRIPPARFQFIIVNNRDLRQNLTNISEQNNFGIEIRLDGKKEFFIS